MVLLFFILFIYLFYFIFYFFELPVITMRPGVLAVQWNVMDS